MAYRGHRISTSLDDEQLERLAVQMKRRGLTDKSSYIRQAILEKLARDEHGDRRLQREVANA